MGWGIPDWISDGVSDINPWNHVPVNPWDAISGLTGAPTSVDYQNTANAQANAEQNFKLQQQRFRMDKDQMEWQRKSQEEAWAREDTAAQRRKKDLEAAGLNPVLAAGQSAQTMAPVQPYKASDAPQKQFVPNTRANVPDPQIMMSLIKMVKDISQTDAQIELTKQQTEKEAANTQSIKQQTGYDLLANPEKLKEQIATNEILGIKKQGEKLRNDLVDSQISISRYNEILKKVQFRLDVTNVTEAEKRLLAQQVALDIAKKELEERTYNLDYYKKRKWPTNSPPGQKEKDITFSWGVARSIWEKILNARKNRGETPSYNSGT